VSCRATGCDKREWMARKFCDRHWKMLPFELQMKIRKLLERKRAGAATPEELQPLFDEAKAIINQREAEEGVAAEIGLFRTRMANVAGTVAALRTIPCRDLHEQLERSRESSARLDPEGHESIRVKIELDLALLEILADASDKLHETITRFMPAELAE
jgi:hypothetical protein